MALLVSVVINLARGNDFTVVFTAAIAFAISAIPTGLPAVVTTILSMGTQMLADAERHHEAAPVDRDPRLHLGHQLRQDRHADPQPDDRRRDGRSSAGATPISGSGYSTEGSITHVAGQPDVPLEPFLLPMALASDAVVHDGELIGDPTEGALVVLAEKGGVDATATRQRYPRVAELPVRRRLQADGDVPPDDRRARPRRRALLRQGRARPAAGPRRVHGCDADDLAPDPRRRGLPGPVPGGEPAPRRAGPAGAGHRPQGLRPGHVRPRRRPARPLEGLTLLALVGIVDPPRPQAKAAIATAKAAGIQVRMITGDHAVTAEAIADQLGIEGRAITGAEFADMIGRRAARRRSTGSASSPGSPRSTRSGWSRSLKRKGHIVAMTGDGVNDAPALKKADIGIAMGITGTEVSKEAAAMILTDDDFATIVKAVELGRGLYDNLRKYVFFQMGALIGFIVTFLGASIFNIAGRRPVPAAADAVGQLHDAGVPGRSASATASRRRT